MGSTEHLPDGWIRKQSRSRPNHFYYFNTKTGKTQWEPPGIVKNQNNKKQPRDDNTKMSKCDASSKGQSKGQSQFKINDKSKNFKKGKSQTPAQDRLQKLVNKNKSVIVESLKEMVELKSSTTVTTSTSKNGKSTHVSDIAKQPHIVSKYSNSTVNCAKSSQGVGGNEPCESSSDIIASFTDEIPGLFSTKTPAQERLRSLQQNLSINDSRSVHDASRVFDDSFGIGNDQQTFESDKMDEEMEWEPCDTNYSFQQLESMAVDILTDSAYIIPDTNVFLDSLASIKSIIEKELKYSILIPFVVLQELDQLKRRSNEDSVSMKASHAIRYIYEQLKSKNPRLQGQKAIEDKTHIIDVTSPDDKILNCCLQLQGQLKEIVLVTNDINLSNKALLNGVEAITSKKCLERF